GCSQAGITHLVYREYFELRSRFDHAYGAVFPREVEPSIGGYRRSCISGGPAEAFSVEPFSGPGFHAAEHAPEGAAVEMSPVDEGGRQIRSVPLAAPGDEFVGRLALLEGDITGGRRPDGK